MRDIVLLDIDESAPAAVALIAVLVADGLLAGSALVATILAVVLAMLATFAYRESGERGRRRRSRRARCDDRLSIGERRLRTAARVLPIASGTVAWWLAGRDAMAAAAVMLASVVAAQAAVGVWIACHPRPSARG